MLKLLAILLAILCYVKGETKTKWLGKSNKNWKLAMGIPIGVLFSLSLHTLLPLLCFLTYLIACEAGYGDNNWITKLIGVRAAITLHGTLVGLASFPIIGWWTILAGIISGASFWWIAEFDDKGKVQEPWVAILRGIAGTILLVI